MVAFDNLQKKDRLKIERDASQPTNTADGTIVHQCPVKQGCICDLAGLRSATQSERRLWGERNKTKLMLARQWKRLLDEAWCICLKERDDRLIASQEEFHISGLCRLVKYFRCVRPTDKECEALNITSRGRYGCWRSHHQIATMALEAHPREKKKRIRVAVFEDDIQFHRERLTVDTLGLISHDIQKHLPKDWDVFKLGQLAFRGYPVPTPCRRQAWAWPRLWRSDSALTHALIWSRSGLSQLADLPFEAFKEQANGAEGDLDLAMINRFQIYACYPQLIRQSESPTSNLHNMGKGALEERWDAFYRQFVIPTFLNQHGKYSNFFDILGYLLYPLMWLGVFLILFTVAFRAADWGLRKMESSRSTLQKIEPPSKEWGTNGVVKTT